MKLLAALKKRVQHRYFLVDFAKFLKTAFYKHLRTITSGQSTNAIIPK